MSLSRLDFFAGCLASRTDVQLLEDLPWLRAVAMAMDEKLPTSFVRDLAMQDTLEKYRAAMREICSITAKAVEVRGTYGEALNSIEKIAARFCDE